MEIKDFLQIYCELTSVDTLLKKLPPEKVDAVLEKLSEKEKEDLFAALKKAREIIKDFVQDSNL